jgi:ADP-dependent NAD(P)H-hydrate dehydratase / NAD(P)H-hydrate epimerase
MSSHFYHSNQIRQWEQRWCEQGNSSYGLMQQAAWAVATWIKRHYQPQTTTVICGTGNNGADGWLVAAYLWQSHWPVQVVSLAEGRTPDHQKAVRFAKDVGVPQQKFQGNLPKTKLMIDAIFGIGLHRAPTGDAMEAIDVMNQTNTTILALDVPSGVDADTGQVWDGIAVQADQTLCLLALKGGLVTGKAKNYIGQVHILPLIPQDAELESMGEHINQIPKLPKRTTNSHKGSHGHALLVGGDQGMAGAVLMAAEAAERSGAGKVTVLSRQEHITAMIARNPNLMSRGVLASLDDVDDTLEEIMPQIDSVAIGMGLGRGEWGKTLWTALLPYLLDAESVPAVVLDADALYHLRDTDPLIYRRNNSHWHCTPHSGEAARLLDFTIEAVEADRYAAVEQLQQRYGGQWVLKGAGSVVLDSTGLTVCGLGNAGMAVGGMGDVLSGLAAGLLAQFPKYPLIEIVTLHAAAGDLAAEQGQRGMIAMDVIEHIRVVVSA